MANGIAAISDMEYHVRIKQCREHFALPQKEMAKRMCLSLRSYQNYERGERGIPVVLVHALYEKFNVDPVWLLIGTGSMIPYQRKCLLLDHIADPVDLFEASMEKVLDTYETTITTELFSVRLDDKARIEELIVQGLAIDDAIETLLRQNQQPSSNG
jgi:transcriptional regulator with XRE-family HTH domain